MSNSLKEILVDSFKKNEATWNGSASSTINQKRKAAFVGFEKKGFPTTKNEEWKYTNLAKLVSDEYNPAANSTLSKEEISSLQYPIEGTTLIFVNGIFRKEYSALQNDSIEITDISAIDSELTEKYFARPTYSSEDGMSLLNTAFAGNGTCVRIKKNKAVDLPILVYQITDSRAGNTFAQPRLLLLAEENTQATVVEVYKSIGSHTGFTNAFTELVLKQDANLDYYKIQDDDSHHHHVGTTEVLHEAKSFSSATTITLGGALTRNNLNITFAAEYCEAHLNGLYLLKGSQHVDNHTIADHAKANCYSNELYKGILDEQSTGVFNGKIFVKQDAQKTNAFQSNKNILLSKEASVNTKPQLEIFADDVKCSHGATTGQLDEEALFYLRARGIGETQAKKLLLHAFANDVLERIRITPLKEILLARMEERLS